MNMSGRPIKQIVDDEAGARRRGRQAAARVRLRRHQPSSIRFSLLDDFRNEQARTTTSPGSRGIRIAASRRSPTCSPARVEHGDSLGNRGSLGAGDVQWMTAGSGILHQEMPQGDAHGRMHGFQLWANLPSSLKMTAAALSGRRRARHSRSRRRRRHARAGHRRRLLGQEGPGRGRRGGSALPRRVGVRPERKIDRRSRRSRQRIRVRVRRRGVRFATHRAPQAVHNEADGGSRDRAKPAIDRSCCSIAATKSPCRRATKGSGSCSSRASRSKKPVAWCTGRS